MLVWIETEDKKRLINAAQIVNLFLVGADVFTEDTPLSDIWAGCQLWAYCTDTSGTILITGLTPEQGQEAMKHLSHWLPSATPRTIRMSELAQSVKERSEGRR